MSKSEVEINEELEHFDDNGKKQNDKKGDLNDKLTTLQQLKNLMEVMTTNNKEKANFDIFKNQKGEKLTKLKEIKQKFAQVFSEYGVDSGDLRLVISV